jgi:hypothetical protein
VQVEHLNMKLIITLFIVFLLPLPFLAAEPAWWTQQKQKCGLPSSLAYNTWAAQGSPCKGSGSVGSSDSGAVIGKTMGDAIVDVFKTADEESQRKKATWEAEETERKRQQALEDEARKQRLLGAMMEVDSNSGLQPLSDDDQKNIMSKHRQRTKRNLPRGVMKQTEIEKSQNTLADQLMVEDEQPPPPVPPAMSEPNVDGFTKGFEHGSGCFSQNAGVACSGVAPPLFESCLSDYRRGYSEGRRAADARIDLAFRNGLRDRRAKQNSRQDSVGNCSMEIMNAYKTGLAGGLHP